jgi:N-glycosylase/DNA lyase
MNNLNTNPLIEQRLNEFKKFKTLEPEYWFSELCFCILTANSKAETAIKIQQELGFNGFVTLPQNKLAEAILKNKHRFHNTKANYIVSARNFLNIKDLISLKTGFQARKFIVENIKGLGYKEASHFLRNVGFEDVAIIDRHILRYMYQQKLIDSIPKQIPSQKYLALERVLVKIDSNLARLDLIIWQQMTGKVLK